MIVVVYCNSISNFEGKKAKEKREHTWHKTHHISSPTGLSLTPCSFGGSDSLKLHVGVGVMWQGACVSCSLSFT